MTPSKNVGNLVAYNTKKRHNAGYKHYEKFAELNRDVPKFDDLLAPSTDEEEAEFMHIMIQKFATYMVTAEMLGENKHEKLLPSTAKQYFHSFWSCIMHNPKFMYLARKYQNGNLPC